MSVYCPKCGYAKAGAGECRRCGTKIAWEDTEPPDPEVMISAFRTTRRTLFAVWGGILLLELFFGAWFLAQPYLPSYAAGNVVSSALGGSMFVLAFVAVLAPNLVYHCPCCGRMLSETDEEGGGIFFDWSDGNDRRRTRLLWNPDHCPSCGVQLA